MAWLGLGVTKFFDRLVFGVGNTAGWVFYLLGMQLWSFWKARNDLLFSSRLFEVDQQVDTIILHF